MKKRLKSTTNLQNKRRMLIFMLCFFLVTIALVIRLGFIQIIEGEGYRKQAMENWSRDITINAKRGIIYDAKGKKLSVSVNSNTVTCFPADVKKGSKSFEDEGGFGEPDSGGLLTAFLKKINKSISGKSANKEQDMASDAKSPEETARILSEILEMNYEEVYGKITSDSQYVVLKRWITEEQALEIKENELNGINVIDDNKRVYPYGDFAPYVLGFTNYDQEGQYGVESTYNEYLTGIPGRTVLNTDNYGRELPFGYNVFYEPRNGLGVVLTVDEVIQHYAESAAQKVLQDYNALRATIIVMDPNNGDVLAMTSKPDYDPNDPKTPTDERTKEQWETLSEDALIKSWYDMWRNPSVNDVYEPGSTFKLLTAAIALEENKASLNSTYYCGGYVTQITSNNIKCWRYYSPHGNQTLSEAIQNSCNVALAEIGLDIGKEAFYKYLKSFGLEEKSEIKLNGEALGILKNPLDMSDVDVVTQAFGQGVAVTPMQLITAISAVSNGGKLMTPRIVKQLIDDDGNVVKSFEPIMRRKVISEETSKIMLSIMKDSAESGTKQAYRPGYRIGGKSGTAQKVINGQYIDDKFISSFIGVAPYDNPKAIALVIVDEPDVNVGYYGSTVAGPVAADLLENILKYYDVEPVYTEEELGNVEKQMVDVPDLIGLTIAEATDKLIKAGLESNIEIEVEADRTVKQQFPKAGERVLRKSLITLTLN